MTQSNAFARRHCVACSLMCLLVPFAILPTTDIEFTTIASWYGPGFHGKKTASGARFDQNKLTAANRTLPFGTRLTVKNLKTGLTCDVVINDRGPYVAGRGIDLSKEAARRIGIKGIAPVLCYNEVAAKRLSGSNQPASPAALDENESVPEDRDAPGLINPQQDSDASSLQVVRRPRSRQFLAHRAIPSRGRRAQPRAVQYVAYLGARRIEYSQISRLNNKFVHNYRNVTI